MKKLLTTLVSSMAMLLSIGLISCDNEYDLTKDLNTDITVGTQFSIPLGKTEKILLSRLIKTGDNITVNNSGIYEISAKGAINSNISPVNLVRLTGFDPILKDVRVEINTPNANLRNIIEINSEFNNVTNYDINIALPAEVEKLSKADLSSNGITPITTTMQISLLDFFPNGIDNITLKDFSIKFPEIFKIAGQESQTITFPDFVLTRNNPTALIDIHFESIKLNEAQQQKFIVGESGSKRLIIDSELVVSSKLNIPVDPTQLTVNALTFRFQYDAPEIQISNVAGTFIPDFKIEEKVALSDIPDFIKGEDSKFGVSDIALNFEFNNTVNMQLATNLIITPWNDKLNIVDGANVIISIPEIKGNTLNKFVISNTARQVPSGYVNIVNPDLTKLLDKIPDSYKITSDKITATSVTANQNFPLGKGFAIDGNYDIVVPFKFKNLDIVYSDSIENLLSDLEDVNSLTKSIRVIAKAVSTVPTDLDFNVIMLDKDRKVLSGIEVDLTKFKVKASVDGAESINDIEFKLTEKAGSNDLSLLEKIVYEAHATSLDQRNDIELKPTQYIFVKDIIVKVPNGISVKP